MKKKLKKILKRVFWIVFAVFILAIALATVCNRMVTNNAKGKVFTEIDSIPQMEYGLLLGTTPQTRIGRKTNLFFKYRIDAIEQLYKKGKIKRILISGAEDSLDGVNEVESMRDSLIAKGVKPEHIVLDGRGVRTLDSVVRTVKAYGITSFVVISQRFHNERAVYLAEHLGLNTRDVVGFNAADVTTTTAIIIYIREYLARVKMFLDIWTGKEPSSYEIDKKYEVPKPDDSNNQLFPQKDSISSFLGHKIFLNDSVYEQIAAIAAQDKMLSFRGQVIQIGKVGWGVNVFGSDIVLLSSVQPDAPQMKQVVEYLNRIYGKPYEDEEDGYDIKWSSSDDPQDIYTPDCTLVRLRRIHSEEGGTTLIFN